MHDYGPSHVQISSSTDKLCSTLATMPQIEDHVEKNKQPFRLKLCQRLADPGGMSCMYMYSIGTTFCG